MAVLLTMSPTIFPLCLLGLELPLPSAALVNRPSLLLLTQGHCACWFLYLAYPSSRSLHGRLLLVPQLDAIFADHPV